MATFYAMQCKGLIECYFCTKPDRKRYRLSFQEVEFNQHPLEPSQLVTINHYKLHSAVVTAALITIELY